MSPHRAALLGALGLAMSCSGRGNLASELATAPVAPAGQAKCAVAKSQSEPLIVEWPSTARGKLEAEVRRGLVAVRYLGCEMQVLAQCRPPGAYGYTAVTRKRDRVVIRDNDDLYTNIPVYAAKFESTLARSGELNVDMTIVGRYAAPGSVVRQDELKGQCEGATHVISAISVGAFEFFAGADAKVGASVGAAGVEAGAKSHSARETLTQDGDKAACDKASRADTLPPDGCGALLRVEVVPIGGVSAACPEGTKLLDGRCQTEAKVSTACPAGTHFVGGKGCVATIVSGGMVRIPGGVMQMGQAGLGSYELPVHQVTVAPFEIDQTEVTAGAYAACIQAGKCDSKEMMKETRCNLGSPRTNHPVNCLSYDQAAAFCAYAGKRLPTEAEWEFAARGTDARTYPWGEDHPSSRTNWSGAGSASLDERGTAPVKFFIRDKSAFGLFDMGGNVSEYTSSYRCSYPALTCPPRDDYRVVRGGSYDTYDLVDMCAAHRDSAGWQKSRLGVRCAR